MYQNKTDLLIYLNWKNTKIFSSEKKFQTSVLFSKFILDTTRIVTTTRHELFTKWLSKFFRFHTMTLELYRAVCSHGNHKVAHELTKHIDQRQLMYCIHSQCEYLYIFLFFSFNYNL